MRSGHWFLPYSTGCVNLPSAYLHQTPLWHLLTAWLWPTLIALKKELVHLSFFHLSLLPRGPWRYFFLFFSPSPLFICLSHSSPKNSTMPRLCEHNLPYFQLVSCDNGDKIFILINLKLLPPKTSSFYLFSLHNYPCQFVCLLLIWSAKMTGINRTHFHPSFIKKIDCFVPSPL